MESQQGLDTPQPQPSHEAPSRTNSNINKNNKHKYKKRKFRTSEIAAMAIPYVPNPISMFVSPLALFIL